ncbi:hypothetical protein LTR84_009216 [Exophiala bonariae]|uniref:Uncharacterized protein n=1 Tax=Exophiala bonariae TaxID=1690606 RepID=A0AAV9MXN0_9EURO|nr:hypothetical protein LTR84_009216 [Exophiala bonariae]
MTATTNPNFGGETEGLEVAAAYADSIKGKTILITGVNQGGIGYSTAESFASQFPALVIIAGRNTTKVQESIDALKTNYPGVAYRALQLDLSTQRGARAAANEVLSWSDVPAIDIVVNNAGIMNIPERTLNADGIEIQFATNHIGHFVFTNSIMPKLLKAAGGKPKGAVRIVNVSSLSVTFAGIRWSDMNFEKVNKDLPEEEQPAYGVHVAWGSKDPENLSYLPLEGYNQSKVANALYSIGLNKRLYSNHGILSLVVHPGVIFTELSRYASPETTAAITGMLKSGTFPIKSLGAGAATTLVAATDPSLTAPEAKNGKENYGIFLLDCQFGDQILPKAESNEGAERLWKVSEKLVNENFSW